MEAFGSDVSVRHAIALPGELVVKHILDISPSVVSVAKEIRNCVFAAALAWAVVQLVRSRRTEH